MSSESVRKDGTVVFVVHFTFKPGHDDDLIRLVYMSPRRFLASRLREVLHRGMEQQIRQESLNQKTELMRRM